MHKTIKYIATTDKSLHTMPPCDNNAASDAGVVASEAVAGIAVIHRLRLLLLLQQGLMEAP